MIQPWWVRAITRFATISRSGALVRSPKHPWQICLYAHLRSCRLTGNQGLLCPALAALTAAFYTVLGHDSQQYLTSTGHREKQVTTMALGRTNCGDSHTRLSS